MLRIMTVGVCLLLLCMQHAALANTASDDDICIFLQTTTDKAKGFDERIKNYIGGKYTYIDEQSFTKRESNIASFLRRAASSAKNTTIFHKAHREQYSLVFTKNYTPGSSIHTQVELVVLRYKNEEDLQTAKKVMDGGMSNKGPIYTFHTQYSRTTAYIILYNDSDITRTETLSPKAPLFAAAQDIVENCLLK